MPCKNIKCGGFFFILESKWFVNFIHTNPSNFASTQFAFFGQVGFQTCSILPKGLPFLLLKKQWTTWIVSLLGRVAWKAETEVPT